MLQFVVLLLEAVYFLGNVGLPIFKAMKLAFSTHKLGIKKEFFNFKNDYYYIAMAVIVHSLLCDQVIRYFIMIVKEKRIKKNMFYGV